MRSSKRPEGRAPGQCQDAPHSTLRYDAFGPTLAAEYLAGEGKKVDRETLRRWRIGQGKPRLRRRRQRHRQWRERKLCFGVMGQLDGSHHDWLMKRVVQRDGTVQHGSQWYQLHGRHETLALAGKSVIVRQLKAGTIQIEQEGQKLKWRKLRQG